MSDIARQAIEKAIASLQAEITAAEEAVIANAKREGKEVDEWYVEQAGTEQRYAILQIKRCVAVFELHIQLTWLFNAVK